MDPLKSTITSFSKNEAQREGDIFALQLRGHIAFAQTEKNTRYECLLNSHFGCGKIPDQDLDKIQASIFSDPET